MNIHQKRYMQKRVQQVADKTRHDINEKFNYNDKCYQPSYKTKIDEIDNGRMKALIMSLTNFKIMDYNNYNAVSIYHPKLKALKAKLDKEVDTMDANKEKKRMALMAKVDKLQASITDSVMLGGVGEKELENFLKKLEALSEV